MLDFCPLQLGPTLPHCSLNVNMATPFTTQRPEILLWGDSLTDRGYIPPYGWALALTGNYRRRCDIIHRGYGGYSTHDALQTLDKILEPYQSGISAVPTGSDRQLAAAIIWFGANDAARPESNRGTPTGNKQHVPLEQYRANLKEIVRRISAVCPRVGLITPPPVHDGQRMQFMLESFGPDVMAEKAYCDRSNDFTALYAQAAVDLGKELGIPVLDLWTKLQELPDWESGQYLDDGLHFTPKGQETIAEVIAGFLADGLKFPLDSTPNQFPPWGDVVGTGEWGKRVFN